MRHRLTREHPDAGFTLVELLTVIVIIGILSAIALPHFLAQKEKGYRATLASDLRNAAAAQEVWAVAHEGEYALDAAELGEEGFNPSDGVKIEVEKAGADGFCLSASHDAAGGPLYYSTATGAPSSDGCGE